MEIKKFCKEFFCEAFFDRKAKFKMRNLLIDGRIRDIELDYLSKYFAVHKLPSSDEVYEEISAHSDIFYCKINDKVICAPNAPIKNNNFIIGISEVKKNYPNYVPYNACQIGNVIIGNKYTDKTINPNIIVKQGYVKCSICVTSTKSCITTDTGICKILNNHGIDATYIMEKNIKLLDKAGKPTQMQGFIGGASMVFDDNFILFGDIEKLESKEKILKHIEKYKLNLINFKGLDVNDYGGGIIY